MWKFYYDESFHDRKVTAKKDNPINIYNDNTSDIYTGFFCGYKNADEPEIWGKYRALEAKYRKIFTLPEDKEFKSTTMHRSNYCNGFASLKSNTLAFYNDFFDVLDDPRIVFHISMFSKTELIIREFSKNFSFPKRIVLQGKVYSILDDSVIYSLTKFLFNYRKQNLLRDMMSADTMCTINSTMQQLRVYISVVIGKSGTSKKKRLERNALEQLHYILGKADIHATKQSELGWRYEPIFIGFNKLLAERGIRQSDVKLIIDEEDNTYAAARRVGQYHTCEQNNSVNCIGIRISDILAHFFGSIAAFIEKELFEGEIKADDDLNKRNYIDKKLLSAKWFDLTELHFELWRKISSIISKYHQYEWIGYDGIFCDGPISVFALLEYVMLYETYKEFQSIPSEEHAQRYNTFACKKLEAIYLRAGTGPAL